MLNDHEVCNVTNDDKPWNFGVPYVQRHSHLGPDQRSCKIGQVHDEMSQSR